MVYWGHGFTWSELYEMPIYLRYFYLKKIEEAIQKQKNMVDNINKPVDKMPKGPRILKK
jgi:hypothetical protein